MIFLVFWWFRSSLLQSLKTVKVVNVHFVLVPERTIMSDTLKRPHDDENLTASHVVNYAIANSAQKRACVTAEELLADVHDSTSAASVFTNAQTDIDPANDSSMIAADIISAKKLVPIPYLLKSLYINY